MNIYELLGFGSTFCWIQGTRTRIVLMDNTEYRVLRKEEQSGRYTTVEYSGLNELEAVRIFLRSENK